LKVCTVCRVEKPREDFSWRDKAKGWVKSECKACQKACTDARKAKDPTAFNEKANARKRRWRAENPNAGKEWYAANREQERARHLQRAQCPEFRQKAKERSARWYRKNTQHHRELMKAWVARNREALREYHRRYAEAHRAEYNEHSRRRRARKRNQLLGPPFTIAQLDQRMSVFGHCCAYCSGPFEEVDHVIPLAKGGAHCLANLRPACRACNRSKWAKSPSEWQARSA
jgi:5-methylcytosine-specific restriction endonuclease McrA